MFTRSHCWMLSLVSFFHFVNLFIMGNILYIIAVILVIGWAIGFLAFNVTGIIHILLVIAVVAFLLQFIRDRRAH